VEDLINAKLDQLTHDFNESVLRSFDKQRLLARRRGR